MKEVLLELFKKADMDSDGRLDFDEWLVFCESIKKCKEKKFGGSITLTEE